MIKTIPRLLTLALLAATSLSACGSQQEAEIRAAGGATVEQCVDANTKVYADDRPADVDSIHGDASLLELKRLSTLTVAGTVIRVEDGVRSGADSRFTYALVTVRPTEVVKGTAPSDIKVAISSMLLNGRHFTDAGQPIPAVGACGIWFLLPTGAETRFNGFWPVSSSAELLFDAAGKLTNHYDVPALEEAEKLGSRDRILALLRSTP